jgi:hypothetical protein
VEWAFQVVVLDLPNAQGYTPVRTAIKCTVNTPRFIAPEHQFFTHPSYSNRFLANFFGF